MEANPPKAVEHLGCGPAAGHAGVFEMTARRGDPCGLTHIDIRYKRAARGAIALTLGPSPSGRGREFLLPLGEGVRRTDEGRIHMATRRHHRFGRLSRPGEG